MASIDCSTLKKGDHFLRRTDSGMQLCVYLGRAAKSTHNPDGNHKFRAWCNYYNRWTSTQYYWSLSAYTLDHLKETSDAIRKAQASDP
jgi:hypothetical protein